ncbi:MAG TPA: hypothetical protein VF623_07620, partial [Segetibacter sp.]
SISLYKNSLSHIAVQILPLFSNIPMVDQGSTQANPSNSFRVIHFGTFTNALNEFGAQLEYIKKVAEATGKNVQFVSIGEGGGGKMAALNLAKEVFVPPTVIEMGRMADNDIASQLLKSDMGVSRADISMYGKSGSTLAMLEYGLPVLLRGSVNDDEINTIENNFYQDQIFFPDQKQLNLPARKSPKSNLENIATIFTGFLSVACK